MQTISAKGCFNQLLLHTGQHYDYRLSQVFFEELGIPQPDVFLGIGSASHAVQTAKIMVAFEEVMVERKPDVVLVVGDVNSTLACALTAAKLRVPVVHVEAGLRSFNRDMPEEINRIVTDALSDLLFVSERSGVENLLAEGKAADRIHLVGNVMIDTLYANLPRARALNVASRFNLQAGEFALVTLHRPSNVDDDETLASILRSLDSISSWLPVLFPVHPRTRAALSRAHASALAADRVLVCEPLSYLEFLSAMVSARLVLTDSGGVQEETTALGIPCLTLRWETERPITVSEGTNILVGTDQAAILRETQHILDGQAKIGHVPENWDGLASSRIADTLAGSYG
jgi:UDP-N-acetylglucosamine 2-epimerase (non-hydrolysing)